MIWNATIIEKTHFVQLLLGVGKWVQYEALIFICLKKIIKIAKELVSIDGDYL